MSKTLKHNRTTKKKNAAAARHDAYYFLYNDHLGTNRGTPLSTRTAGRLGRAERLG